MAKYSTVICNVGRSSAKLALRGPICDHRLDPAPFPMCSYACTRKMSVHTYVPETWVVTYLPWAWLCLPWAGIGQLSTLHMAPPSAHGWTLWWSCSILKFKSRGFSFKWSPWILPSPQPHNNLVSFMAKCKILSWIATFLVQQSSHYSIPEYSGHFLNKVLSCKVWENYQSFYHNIFCSCGGSPV